MIDDWTSYAIADFIPFTAEVYVRLLERVGESYWPLHVASVALGLFILWCAWTRRLRRAGLLLAIVVAWVAVVFVSGPYAELNWAGRWLGFAWLVTAGLLALFAAFPGPTPVKRVNALPRVLGTGLAVFGMLGYPLIGLLVGHGAMAAETFGLHADPTAVAMLGIALMLWTGLRLWLVALVPLLWCLLSGLTLQALDIAWFAVPLAAAALALVGLVAAVVEGQRFVLSRGSSGR
ncbi:MAG: MFS transporter permease [Wenzhouxiangellaceae bacterium]|nr:MFS transporter permease [Wenzhouxiangellaceae bacterium]